MAREQFKPISHNWAFCRDFATVEVFKRARDFGMTWPQAVLVRFETAEQAALNARAAKHAHIEATEEKTKLARHATELEIKAADDINRKSNAVEEWTATQPPNTDFTLRRMQAFEAAAMVAIANLFDELSVPATTKALRTAWKKTEWPENLDRSVREQRRLEEAEGPTRAALLEVQYRMARGKFSVPHIYFQEIGKLDAIVDLEAFLYDRIQRPADERNPEGKAPSRLRYELDRTGDRYKAYARQLKAQQVAEEKARAALGEVAA